jgi:hypothetical protein
VSLSLSQALALYTWFPLAGLLLIMLMIARFYERFSGRRTYYRLYLVPLVAFAIGAVRYADRDRISGDLIGDSALIVGGLTLLALSVSLYWRMVIQPKPNAVK